MNIEKILNFQTY